MQANTDPLTGLSNRRGLALYLDGDRRHRALSMLVMDIDGLKIINDAHGHDVGDKILVGVARAASGTLRGGDLLARIGGDEFVAVVADSGRIGHAPGGGPHSGGGVTASRCRACAHPSASATPAVAQTATWSVSGSWRMRRCTRRSTWRAASTPGTLDARVITGWWRGRTEPAACCQERLLPAAPVVTYAAAEPRHAPWRTPMPSQPPRSSPASLHGVDGR